MRCRYLKLLNRYCDNELDRDKKEFMDQHLLACPICQEELKGIFSIKDALKKRKGDFPAEFFWQALKDKIRAQEDALSKNNEFAFDFIRWSRRLIPVPVLASILIIIFLNLNQNSYTNPVDEYLFTNQSNNVLALIDDAGQQSELRLLLY